MWRLWVSGFAGLVVVLLPFLGLTLFMHTVALVVLGIVISVLSFWLLSEIRNQIQ